MSDLMIKDVCIIPACFGNISGQFLIAQRTIHQSTTNFITMVEIFTFFTTIFVRMIRCLFKHYFTRRDSAMGTVCHRLFHFVVLPGKKPNIIYRRWCDNWHNANTKINKQTNKCCLKRKFSGKTNWFYWWKRSDFSALVFSGENLSDELKNVCLGTIVERTIQILILISFRLKHDETLVIFF